ncbi:MAG: ZPR1 zinc finger domain-containing protein [Thermoplasmatota archaeon]
MNLDEGVAARCPACRATGLRVKSIRHELPYFGECLETVVQCDHCSFRHADFMVLGDKEPSRFTLKIESAEDLGTRVVRSNSATFRVPELGFTAEPTPRSEAFVSNIEGVLERVRNVLLIARRVHDDDPAKMAVVDERLEHLARILALESPATVILEDPLGNSRILSERAEREALTAEEAALLETGVIFLERDELK